MLRGAKTESEEEELAKTPEERAAAFLERQKKAFDGMGETQAAWKIVLARAVVSLFEGQETISADDLRAELSRLREGRATLSEDVDFTARATEFATERAIAHINEAVTKRVRGGE